MRGWLLGVGSVVLVAFGIAQRLSAEAPAERPSTGAARAVPTRVCLQVEDGHGLVYQDKRMTPASGVVSASDVLVFQRAPARLSLRFERPVQAASVTAALERSLHGQARLAVEWPRPDLARLRLEWDAPPPGEWHRITFSDADGPPALDARGHPIELALPTIELHPALHFQRWRPTSGNHVGAAVPPRLTVFAHTRAVAGRRVLLQHFEEEAGDYLLHVPALVDIETGVMHRLHAPPGIESAQWLPGGQGIVLPAPGRLRLFDTRAVLRKTVEFGADNDILDIAIDPLSGTMATAVLQPSGTEVDGLTARLEIHSPDGARLVSIPELTGIARLELGLESPQPTWLPDGRLAFLHRVPRAPAVAGTPRELVILDPKDGRRVHTGQRAGRILGMSRRGIVLLLPAEDAGTTTAPWVYRLHDNASEDIGLPRGGSFSLRAISPDGDWIAGIEYTSTGTLLGAFRVEDRTWHVIGRGALVGWDEDGSLVWMR